MPLIRVGSQASGFTSYTMMPPSRSIERGDRDRVEMGDAVGLVDAPGDRLEAHDDIEIGRDETLVDRERKAVVGGIRAGLGDDLAGAAGRIGDDAPLGGGAAAGASDGETGGRGSYRHRG